ncbi:hypothetical protein ACYX7E_14670 [Luteimonas sp. RIT-PG2_3]
MNSDEVETALMLLHREMAGQASVALLVPKELMSFDDQIEQIREWIEDAGEYGIAYQSMVALLESYPFSISGPAAIKLLEVGLSFGFKAR